MRQLVATVLIDHNCLEKTFSEETTSGEMYLHCNWFLELANLLNLIHQVSTIDKLHHKVQSILKKI